MRIFQAKGHNVDLYRAPTCVEKVMGLILPMSVTNTGCLRHHVWGTSLNSFHKMVRQVGHHIKYVSTLNTFIDNVYIFTIHFSSVPIHNNVYIASSDQSFIIYCIWQYVDYGNSVKYV